MKAWFQRICEALEFVDNVFDVLPLEKQHDSSNPLLGRSQCTLIFMLRAGSELKLVTNFMQVMGKLLKSVSAYNFGLINHSDEDQIVALIKSCVELFPVKENWSTVAEDIKVMLVENLYQLLTKSYTNAQYKVLK